MEHLGSSSLQPSITDTYILSAVQTNFPIVPKDSTVVTSAKWNAASKTILQACFARVERCHEIARVVASRLEISGARRAHCWPHLCIRIYGRVLNYDTSVSVNKNGEPLQGRIDEVIERAEWKQSKGREGGGKRGEQEGDITHTQIYSRQRLASYA